MAERVQPSRESFGTGPGPQDPFESGDGTGLVLVSSSGLYNEHLPVAGLTVGEIRTRFRDRMDIDPDSHGELDGRPVSDDEVVRPGQLLAFVRHAGEKGASVYSGPVALTELERGSPADSRKIPAGTRRAAVKSSRSSAKGNTAASMANPTDRNM